MQIDHPNKVNSRYTLLGWFVFFSVITHGLFLAFADRSTDTHPENKLYINLSNPLQVTVISSRSAPDFRQTDNTESVLLSDTQAVKDITVVDASSGVLPLSMDTRATAQATNRKTTASPKLITGTAASNISVSPSDHDNVSTAVITNDKDTNKQNHSTNEVSLNHLRKQLKESIRARFTYPRMAQRMGWEGLVGLSLHIKDDGSLNQVRVAHSSGHKVLDENARKTIQSIGRLQLASNMVIRAADTEIEVLYRLQD